MKAIILAGGYGTRLGALTENKAKALLEVAGKTILDHLLEKLMRLSCLTNSPNFSNLASTSVSSTSISSIHIVTNQKFYADFAAWKARKIEENNSSSVTIPLTIINDGTTNNENRLGSIGDINFAIEQEKINDDLLILGGDNLFEDDLPEFISFFQKKGTSIMLYDVKSMSLARTLGIASVDPRQKIISFVEKPEQPTSTLASTLIYALKKEHLSFIKRALAGGKADRAGDFIKYLSECQEVFGMPLRGKWFDIGTPESLKKAGEFFAR